MDRLVGTTDEPTKGLFLNRPWRALLVGVWPSGRPGRIGTHLLVKLVSQGIWTWKRVVFCHGVDDKTCQLWQKTEVTLYHSCNE